jgi:5-hydroxyisourate hydrolase-like protein (transthyretin family)
MPFIDLYNIGYSEQFSVAGREERTENLDLIANPAATSGTLTGTVTSNNATIAGATVKLFDVNNNPIEHTTTNSQGVYTFTNVPVGSYNVVAISTGFLLSNAIPVTIQDDQTTTADIILVPDPDAGLSSIFGIISSNIGNTPIENATVTLFSVVQGEEPTLLGTANTNNRGQYLFVNLATGSYLVSASKPGFTSNQTGTIPVGTNQFISSDLILTSNSQTNTGTISGFISDENTNLPIANATVALYSISGGVERIIALTKTSNSGRYLFANVAPGNYRVKATVQTQG